MRKFNNKQLILRLWSTLAYKILPPDLKTFVYFFFAHPLSMEIGILNFWLGLLVTALMKETYFSTIMLTFCQRLLESVKEGGQKIQKLVNIVAQWRPMIFLALIVIFFSIVGLFKKTIEWSWGNQSASTS